MTDTTTKVREQYTATGFTDRIKSGLPTIAPRKSDAGRRPTRSTRSIPCFDSDDARSSIFLRGAGGCSIPFHIVSVPSQVPFQPIFNM
jgi:hypothetical protein